MVEFIHPVLPCPTRQEVILEECLWEASDAARKRLFPAVLERYDELVRIYERTHGRPASYRTAGVLMAQDPFIGAVADHARQQQDQLWAVVLRVASREQERVERCAQLLPNVGGSITLDASFIPPRYATIVDIHRMPGGYGTAPEGNLLRGALYDHGTYRYGGGWLGDRNDDMGITMVRRFLPERFPDLDPTRILEIGCSVGHSLVPYALHFSDAEVHGIDLSAPLLQYADARARGLRASIHFSQQCGERTHFLDGSFDLIVSHILTHEVPPRAISRIFRECHRLLRVGGVMAHLEGPSYRVNAAADPRLAAFTEWSARWNNEPFLVGARELDLAAVARDAGFRTVAEDRCQSWYWSEEAPEHLRRMREWYVYSAVKE